MILASFSCRGWQRTDILRLRVRVGFGRSRSRVGYGETWCEEGDGYGELRRLGSVECGAQLGLRHGNVRVDSRNPRLLLDAVFRKRRPICVDADRNTLEAGHFAGRLIVAMFFFFFVVCFLVSRRM